jgi:hypothetical protein
MADSSEEQLEELERFVNSIIHKLSSLLFRVQAWIVQIGKAHDEQDDETLRGRIQDLQEESDTLWVWWEALREEYYAGMDSRENLDDSEERLIKLDHLATEAFLLTYIPPRALQFWTPELAIAYQMEDDARMRLSIDALQENVDKSKSALQQIRDEYASMRDE